MESVTCVHEQQSVRVFEATMMPASLVHPSAHPMASTSLVSSMRRVALHAEAS